jgi:predicted metal-dependent HD superfamily phosphohydrolase
VSEPHVSEILPGLYRAVLDAVAVLEARHRRREAAEIRTEATRVYSRAWTADAARRLRDLLARSERFAEPRLRSRYEAVVETLGRPVDLERKLA